MYPHKREIKNDLFDIAARARELDPDYRIFFDTVSGRFELHNMRFKDTLQCVLPFDRLDARTVDYIRETRIENADRLLIKIERENDALYRKTASEIKSKALDKLEGIL
jgi:hypothetical protein